MNDHSTPYAPGDLILFKSGYYKGLTAEVYYCGNGKIAAMCGSANVVQIDPDNVEKLTA